MNYKFVKRLADIFISLVCLPIVIPISIIVVILIKCNSKGPVIFKQHRIGLNCKPFIIYKFRTMKINLNRIEKQVYLCDGDIIFSLHGSNYPTDKKEYPTKIINIEKGDMVLFPSSLFHATIPFNSNKKRITLAFDIIPKA